MTAPRMHGHTPAHGSCHLSSSRHIQHKSRYLHSSGSVVCQASKEEILARIAKAKQYKEDPPAPAPDAPSQQPQISSATTPSSLPASGNLATQPAPSSWLGALGFSDEADAQPAPQEEQQETAKREWVTGKYIPVPEVSELYSTAPKRAGTGSDAEAADWLKGVLANKSQTIDPNMRMEAFTEAKEEAIRQRGADIITIDPNYRPDLPDATAEPSSKTSSTDDSQEPGPKYKPKVTTWGVFPRPKNISQAFGGGRNLQPGQELESKEQAEARNKEYQAMLSKYKRAIGAEVDPVAQAQAQVLYEKGMQLFEAGLLRDSIDKFDKVLELMALRSELGGRATLQKALALDSLGQNKEAEALYKSIRSHPTGAVAKKAQQFYFGFEAATFLRTDRLNYGVKKEDYMKYFRQFADRNKLWVATEEEKARDERTARASVVIAVMVLGTPLALAAALAASGHH